MKGIYFDQQSSPVLEAPTLCLIVAIDAAYHLKIDIADFTNALHNTLKASSEREIIYWPPHYISWFKLRFPTICIAPAPNVQYII